MSNQSVKTLVEQTIKEFTDTSNKVSPRLIYLAKLAKHYKTFEEFENDYQGKNYHGIYWHLTTDPNFTINPFKGPRDLSSMGSGTASEPGLMVSTDLNNWHSTFNKKRQYVAQIDLSDLIPNVDYRDTSRGFGHEIYVFKPEGAKVVKVLPISKALKQNYDDYRRNLPQNQAQLKRIYDLAHQNDIKESHIDPSTSKNENRFEVSDLEHKYAVEYIKEKLLPALIKQFNDIREGKNRELAQYGKRYKGPFNEPITDVESTIRSLHRINKKYNSPIWMPDYGKFTYAATSSNGAIFEFIIEKSYPHVIRINSLDPWGLGYMGYELKPNGYPGGSLGYDALMKENKSLTKEKFDISKEEEQIIVGYISKKLLEDAMEDFNKQRDWYNALLKKSYRFLTYNDIEPTVKGLKKVGDEKLPTRKIKYSTKAPNGFYFEYIISKEKSNVISISELCGWGVGTSDYKLKFTGAEYVPLTENAQPTDVLTKEDEMMALQFIRNIVRYTFGDMDFSELKKVPDTKKYPNTARYATPSKGGKNPFTLNFRIVKLDGKVLVQDDSSISPQEKHWYPLDYPGTLKENTEKSNLHISKEEEQFVLQRLRLRKDNQGETIGKYLKKIEHTISNDPKQSDRIKFKNTDDGYTFTIVKNPENGKLGIRFGFIALTSATGVKLGDDYESSSIEPITESAPTGDWQGWGDITDLDKNRLKIVLGGYMNQIKNTYHPHIADPKIYLIKKSINNFDVSDPRFAARPLARLSMEDRLSIGDFVDHADTAGNSSKTLDFLLNISRQYIEPPRPPTPDIVLDNIAEVVWPSGKRKSDVTIHGLDDMKPIIGFGYAGYALTDNFIKEYSKPGAQLYIDLGADVRVTNMAEVMKKVQQALEQYNRSNISEARIFDPKFYQPKKIEISKEEEARAYEFIKNIVVDGERVGKTLKKSFVVNTADDHTSDMIVYTAKVKGKDLVYRVIKGLRRGLIVRDASPDGNWEYWEVPLTETAINFGSQHHFTFIPPISKEEEDKAVHFLQNILYGKSRLGRTLKKSDVIRSPRLSMSDIIVFTADVKGKRATYKLTKKEDGTLIIHEDIPDGPKRIWSVRV